MPKQQAQTRGEGTAPTHSQSYTKRTWVVSTMLRQPNPRWRTGAHCIGWWVGFGASMDGTEDMAPTGFDPQIVQPAACRYTNYATTAAYFNTITLQCWCLQFKFRTQSQFFKKKVSHIHTMSSQHRPNVFKKEEENKPTREESISTSFNISILHLKVILYRWSWHVKHLWSLKQAPILQYCTEQFAEHDSCSRFNYVTLAA